MQGKKAYQEKLFVNFSAMKRANTTGIEQADKCATVAALAYKLKKLLMFRKTKPKTAIKVMEVMKSVQKSLFSFLYRVWLAIENIAASSVCNYLCQAGLSTVVTTYSCATATSGRGIKN